MGHRSNQHFVPQFYFRRFSVDGRSIAALLRNSGKVIERASIAGQASGHRFYGEAEIERALGEADAQASAALRALDICISRKGSIPEMDEYADVLAHIVLQQSRTLTARARNKAMNEPAASDP